MQKMLADGDTGALELLAGASPLRWALGTRLADFEAALSEFDFDRAAAMLRQLNPTMPG